MSVDEVDRARAGRSRPRRAKPSGGTAGGVGRVSPKPGQKVNEEPDQIRKEVSHLLARLAALGVSDKRIRHALGLTPQYFARLKAEAHTAAPTKGIIGRRLRDALRGIVQLVEQPAATLPYEERIEQEIGSLRKGDKQVLVTVPPPMELSSERIRRAIAKAVCRGVEFHYYFPSEKVQDQTVKLLTRAEDKAREKGEEPVASVQQYLGWLGGINDNVKHFRLLLEIEMTQLDMLARLGTPIAENAPAPGTYLDELNRLVRISRYDWIFLGFNEKLIWITDGSKEHRIRKEILRPTDQNLPIYDEAQEWDSIPLLNADRLLRTLIRASRSTVTDEPVSARPTQDEAPKERAG